MKEKIAFIIGAYPDNVVKESALKMTLESVNRAGIDTILVTHCHVEDNIVNSCNYYIYDKNNTFLSPKYSPFYWSENSLFRVEIYNGGHTLPICRNIFNGTRFAEKLGYDFFVYMEGDVVLSESDLDKLKLLLYKTYLNDKKMFFFKPDGYKGTEGSSVYETILFGGNLMFFNENMPMPINEDEWLSFGMGYTFEQTFYEKLKNYENDFIIIESHGGDYFDTSQFNLIQYGVFNYEVIPEHDGDKLFLYMGNVSHMYNKVSYKLYMNGEFFKTYDIGRSNYGLENLVYNDNVLSVEAYDYDTGILLSKKTFALSRDNANTFNLKGKIKFKNK